MSRIIRDAGPFAVAIIAALAVADVSSAQSPTSWTRGASTFGAWPGTGSWNLSAGPEPDATTQVLVGVNTFTMAAGLNVTTGVGNVSGSAAGIVFTNTTAKYLRGQPGNNLNANDHRLRIASSGITLTSTSGATGNVALGLFINNSFAPLAPVGTFTFDVNDAQTFTNDSASYLQLGQSNWTTGVFIRPGVDSTAGTHPLTFSGTGTGTFDIYGILQDQPADATKLRSLVVNRANPLAGAVRLFANNTYTGSTAITAGTLVINGTNSGGGATTVGGAGVIGGLGSLAGPVTFDVGSKLLFNAAGPLTASGSVTFVDPSAFGIDDVVGVDSTVPDGTYTLISGAVNTSGLANLGPANAFDLGAGKSAYFQPGGLQLVVVPEPVVGSMLGVAGIVAAGSWRRWLSRRRAS
jgi:autotransporter-associated beta strand protein